MRGYLTAASPLISMRRLAVDIRYRRSPRCCRPSAADSHPSIPGRRERDSFGQDAHLVTGSYPRSDAPTRTCGDQGAAEAKTAWSTTNGREPPPTHLADVLGRFLIDSREGAGLKQLECSTKKLMLSKTKLGEDIPGGSPSESVPTSDELDHGALIADPAMILWSRRGDRSPAESGWHCVVAPSSPPYSQSETGGTPRGCPVKRSARRSGSPCRRRCSSERMTVAIAANPNAASRRARPRQAEMVRDTPTRASGSILSVSPPPKPRREPHHLAFSVLPPRAAGCRY